MHKSERGRRWVAKLKFAFGQILLSGLKARLLLAALIVVVVAVIAGVLAASLDEGFSDPAEAVWWAFLRLTDPGYLGDDKGIARTAISTIVTVLGYVLFLGLLIAILTQWLNQTITKLESGVSSVALSNHVIILGWTYQTAAIVEALLRTGGRVERFLARRGAQDLRIVIMVDRVDAARLREIRDQVGPTWSDRRVLVRSGTPLRVDHLERVAFRDAAVAILPGAGFSEQNPERIDAVTIKTLASISRYAIESATPPPFAVAELFDARRVEVANQSYNGASEAIAADAIVSRLIAQSVRHRGLWSVMSELFTLNEGNAIYLHPVEGQEGAKFGSLRGRFSRAILLGFVRPSERRPALDPDPETLIEADDMLVLLARSFDDCVLEPGESVDPMSEIATEALRPPSGGPRRVLILGWSRKVPALLRELVRFGDDAFEIAIVSRTSIGAREAGMAKGAPLNSGAKVKQIEEGFSTPGVIEGLAPETYDHIIVLASELLEEKEHADAISVVGALTLRGLLPEDGDRPQLLVELLDQENQYLFRGGSEDVMVTPVVVSYLVSQVALRRELARVFWELTSPYGVQILLRNAEAYLVPNGPVRFGDIQRIAMERGEIALGYRRPSDPEGGLSLNPDRDAEWSVEANDEVVVLMSIEAQEEADKPRTFVADPLWRAETKTVVSS